MCNNNSIVCVCVQYLNVKLNDISVPDPDKYPHMVNKPVKAIVKLCAFVFTVVCSKLFCPRLCGEVCAAARGGSGHRVTAGCHQKGGSSGKTDSDCSQLAWLSLPSLVTDRQLNSVDYVQRAVALTAAHNCYTQCVCVCVCVCVCEVSVAIMSITCCV